MDGQEASAALNSYSTAMHMCHLVWLLPPNTKTQSKLTDVFEEYFAAVYGTIIGGHKAPDDLQMQDGMPPAFKSLQFFKVCYKPCIFKYRPGV